MDSYIAYTKVSNRKTAILKSDDFIKDSCFYILIRGVIELWLNLNNDMFRNNDCYTEQHYPKQWDNDCYQERHT